MKLTEQQFANLQSCRAPQLLAVKPQVSGQQRMQALGRLKTGEQNKTEARYDAYLAELKAAGKILWYQFEGIKLRLADNTFLTVDFAVLPADNVLEMIDVKGAKALFLDDARVKMKVAAAMYPFVFKVAYPRSKKDGGGWDEELV